jgi:hypothetical protein
MRSAFRLVARLGPGPCGYPWILADARNWVLRLGPGRGDDDRFYSNLPSLIEGLTVHWLRRRLGPVDGLQLLLREHRAALAEARDLGRRLAAALNVATAA